MLVDFDSPQEYEVSKRAWQEQGYDAHWVDTDMRAPTDAQALPDAPKRITIGSAVPTAKRCYGDAAEHGNTCAGQCSVVHPERWMEPDSDVRLLRTQV